MKITNTKIYDFEETLVASGLPKMAEYSEEWIANEIRLLQECENITDNPHFERACKLAATPPGSGHNNFLSGILVSMNVTATNVWWMQMERYHFVQIVSSQSKMHRLKQMLSNGQDIDKYFNSKTLLDDKISSLVNKDLTKEQLVYTCPGGLELTARITTNYLALKTIYGQRHCHELQEWRDFCQYIAQLPFADLWVV